MTDITSRIIDYETGVLDTAALAFGALLADVMEHSAYGDWDSLRDVEVA